ncbi:MAG: hypothetical protein ACRDL0_12400 [Thermoleophilaceae bacterium]
MTLETIVVLSLVAWGVVIPALVVGLRLRRVRFAEAFVQAAAPRPRPPCERRRRLAHGSSARRHIGSSR